MPPVRIEISWADGRSVERLLDSESIVIGSGPDATLQIIDAPEVAPAHLLVMPRTRELWVSGMRDAKVPVMFGGKAFDNGLLPYGAEIDIGSVTVRLLRPATGKTGPWRKVGIAAAVVGIVYTFLPSRASSLARFNEDPPVLFAAMSGTCPEEQRAITRATEALAAADAREIRYSFDRAEGIAAVGQLRIAELCAKRAQNAGMAKEVQERRLALEGRIESDFKALRLTLDRAMTRQDMVTIYTSTQHMRRLVGHRPGHYLTWLSELERKASEELTRAGILVESKR